jgi:hypothetical protein
MNPQAMATLTNAMSPAGGGMPPMPQQGPPTATQVAPQPKLGQVAPSYNGQGQLTWPQIFQAIKKANPNASPMAVAKAVDKFQGVMTAQSQADWKQQLASLQLETRKQIADEADQTRRDIASSGNSTKIYLGNQAESGRNSRFDQGDQTKRDMTDELEGGRNSRFSQSEQDKMQRVKLVQDMLKDRQLSKQQADTLIAKIRASSSIESSGVRDDTDSGTARADAAAAKYKTAGGAAPAPTAPAALPPEIVSQLKEGIHTTLNDGSVWTLQNGQPTKVK